MSRTGFIQNELDLKLLVLYIMARAAAPITFLQLLDLALCDAGVDYFSLTEAVNHLVETEHLAQEGGLYSTARSARAASPTPFGCAVMRTWFGSTTCSSGPPWSRPT